MSLQLLLDMNLSPRLAGVLQSRGWEAIHWSEVGEATATDAELMAWARSNDRVVVTHDLDFGTILATTGADGPSVLLIRAQDVLQGSLEELLVRVLGEHEEELSAGALIVLDELRTRIRILPLKP